MGLFWPDASSEGGSNPPPPPALHHRLSGQPLLSPPRSSDILFLGEYKVPAVATAPASAAALTKVTSNDPGATLELALTGRAGSRGETGCVDAFLVTLN
ncbi:hypothetical protein CesoFtcFv8_016777 [Champsocephalus esox]|uniref:Uncharacterized protein n=1 Tax=Champsocephalus esox TaxID=159716 RepID=A0AAN8GSC4_9TELE|nr:hypothetical protein CesoFtcFv8_016777 [Champsocephalus esox]